MSDDRGEPTVIRRIYQFEEILTRVPDEPVVVVEDFNQTTREEVSTRHIHESTRRSQQETRPERPHAMPQDLNQPSSGYHVFPPTPMPSSAPSRKSMPPRVKPVHEQTVHTSELDVTVRKETIHIPADTGPTTPQQRVIRHLTERAKSLPDLMSPDQSQPPNRQGSGQPQVNQVDWKKTRVDYLVQPPPTSVSMEIKLPEHQSATLKFKDVPQFEPVKLDITLPQEHKTQFNFAPTPGYEPVEMAVKLPKQHKSQVDYKPTPGYEPVNMDVQLPQEHNTQINFAPTPGYESVEMAVKLPEQHKSQVDYKPTPGYEPVNMDVQLPQEHKTQVNFAPMPGYEQVDLDIKPTDHHRTQVSMEPQPNYQPVCMDIKLPQEYRTQPDSQAQPAYPPVHFEVTIPKQRHPAPPQSSATETYERIETTEYTQQNTVSQLSHPAQPLTFAPVELDITLPGGQPNLPTAPRQQRPTGQAPVRQKGFGTQYRVPAPQQVARRARSETPEAMRVPAGQLPYFQPDSTSDVTDVDDSGIERGDR